MSVEVRIPKEITEYQEKIICGLSIRQLICTVIAMIISIPSYIFLLPSLGVDITGYVVILEVVPFIALGFLRPRGLKFEKVLLVFLKHQLGNSKRKFNSIVQSDLLEGECKDVRNQQDENEKFVGRKVKEAREYEGFESSKKDRERKFKEAKKQIKRAKRDFRQRKNGR